MQSNLTELRIRLDQMTEQIVSGMKNRSRFPLNEGVFTKEFFGKKTWFMYRLKAEQDIDSEFGRFLYSDQHPIIFDKKDLTKPIISREVPKTNLKQINIDHSEEIIRAYREALNEICVHAESEAHYGEVAKMDVDNVLLFNERILGAGEFVAQYKLASGLKVDSPLDREKIRKQIINLQREEEVVKAAIELAKRYGIKQFGTIGAFMRKIISITTEVEIDYIISALKIKN
jgi:chorismate mutase